MEHCHQAQEKQQKKQGKLFKETRSSNNSKNKYVGVRQRSSGKWVAEIKDTTKKIRMWLGTFESAEEAARAYDEAAFLLRGSNTRTNFATQVSTNSVLSLKIRNLLNLKKKGSKPMKPTSSIITTTASGCSTACNTTSFSSHNNATARSSAAKNFNSNMFDDAYKPDMSYCFDFGEELVAAAMPYLNNSWRLSVGFNKEGIELTKGLDLSSNKSELELTEVERIKVEIERSQISLASLYAMNENECMDINACDYASWDWDLSSFSHLYCSS